MDVVDFASRVYKLLRSREEYIKEVLAADGLPSWEEYKKLVGELRGLSYASAEMKALLEKNADYDEETLSS
tara:strand:+ start:2577 stop:2789 length:213 start_codon:yes stop_codon:yes gene_type:complete